MMGAVGLGKRLPKRVKLHSSYIRQSSCVSGDAPEDQMTKPLVDHLTVCAKLARTDGNPLIEYLIRMALLEARPKGNPEQSGK
jgi:hypothetical protein